MIKNNLSGIIAQLRLASRTFMIFVRCMYPNDPKLEI